MLIHVKAVVGQGRRRRRRRHGLERLGRVAAGLRLRRRRRFRRQGLSVHPYHLLAATAAKPVLGGRRRRWRVPSLTRGVRVLIPGLLQRGLVRGLGPGHRLSEQALEQLSDRGRAPADDAQSELELAPDQEVADGV